LNGNIEPSARGTIIERWFTRHESQNKAVLQQPPSEEKPIFKIKLFIKLFVLWSNFIKPHQTLKRTPATPITSVSAILWLNFILTFLDYKDLIIERARRDERDDFGFGLIKKQFKTAKVRVKRSVYAALKRGCLRLECQADYR